MITGYGISNQARTTMLGGTSTAYESLCMRVPVLACLNASGGVKFIRIRAQAAVQTCVAKLSAAHSSGVISLLFFFVCYFYLFLRRQLTCHLMLCYVYLSVASDTTQYPADRPWMHSGPRVHQLHSSLFCCTCYGGNEGLLRNN